MVPADTKDYRKEYNILMNELQQYNPELLDKERFLVISKSDFIDEELKVEISEELKGIPHMFISSITGQGITQLKDKIWQILNNPTSANEVSND
jgi:GTP-binding protein